MAQHNLVLIDGLSFYQFDDGSLFPVMAGGDSPSAPGPDAGLVGKQNELLQMQIENARESQALKPIMLQQAGLKYNPDTKAYEYTDPTLQSNKQEIERMQTERSLKALRGELPVSETLKKELELGKNKMNEKLYRQLGPGYDLSTPGQMAKGEYDRMATALKEGEQRDMLTTAESLALARGNSRQSNMATFENPFVSQARMLEPASAGVDRARGQDNFGRNLSMQGSMAAGQERAGYVSGAIGLAGLGAMAFMSDPALKTDIEPVSDVEMLAAVKRIPVSRWRYKDDPEKRKYIGGMADAMPEIVSDGHQYNVISYLGMLTSAVRALDKKVSGEALTPAMALAL